MRNLLAVLILVINCGFVRAADHDSVNVTGKVDTLCNVNNVKIQAYYAGVPVVDTIPIDAAGNFELKLPTKVWQYSLAVSKIHYNFLVAPSEQTYQFTVTCKDNSSWLKQEDSKENEAFGHMMKIYDMLIDDAVKIVSQPVANDSCWAMFHTLFLEKDTEVEDIKRRYAGTFGLAVSYDLLELPKFKPDTSFVQEVEAYMMTKKVWNDTSIYHTELAIDMIGFLSVLEARLNDDQRAALMNYKLAHQPSNPEACRLFQFNLFQFLFYQGKEKLLRVFCDWARLNPDGVKGAFLKYQLQHLDKVVYGKQFVDVDYNDPTGAVHKLSNVVGKQAYTMLVFWSPNCTHCKETMPKIIDLYDTYKPKGLEVFTIAGDCETKEWVDYCHDYLPNWVNVREPGSSIVSAFADYMVSNIPAFVLIDKDGIIQSRYGTLKDLQKLLDAKLK